MKHLPGQAALRDHRRRGRWRSGSASEFGRRNRGQLDRDAPAVTHRHRLGVARVGAQIVGHGVRSRTEPFDRIGIISSGAQSRDAAARNAPAPVVRQLFRPARNEGDHSVRRGFAVAIDNRVVDSRSGEAKRELDGPAGGDLQGRGGNFTPAIQHGFHIAAAHRTAANISVDVDRISHRRHVLNRELEIVDDWPLK